MRVRITGPAEKDLELGYLFYEQQQAGLGTYLLDALYTDIDSLSFYAGIHLKLWGYHRLLSKSFPFAIYYSIDKNTVLVLAESAVTLSVAKRPGANAVHVVDTILEKVASLKGSLIPEDMKYADHRKFT